LTFAGGVVLVLLLSPDLLGSVVAGFGAIVPGAVPAGVLLSMVLVVPVGGGAVSIVLEVVPLPVGLATGGGAVVVDVSVGVDVDDDMPPPVVVVLPEVDDVDGFAIELSVFGWSGLLQAPSAARVAAMATHLIERCMFAPRWWGLQVAPAPEVRSSVNAGSACGRFSQGLRRRAPSAQR
jgi:hypothetical protein